MRKTNFVRMGRMMKMNSEGTPARRKALSKRRKQQMHLTLHLFPGCEDSQFR